jgi:hypothetical protein
MTPDEKLNEAIRRLQEAIAKAVAERLAEEDARTDENLDEVFNAYNDKETIIREFRNLRKRQRGGK